MPAELLSQREDLRGTIEGVPQALGNWRPSVDFSADYGKNRVHRIPMTCPNCGAYSDLESYDTTKYFVLFFVPLVPLSRWRVIEKCPICTQHRAIKLKDWEEAKQKDSAAVTEELRRDPQNPETVQKVIGVATSLCGESSRLRPYSASMSDGSLG